MIRIITTILPFVLMLGACSVKPGSVAPDPITVERVVTKTVPIAKPSPQVPSVDPLKLRDVNWHVITRDNIEEKFAELEGRGERPVMFAITTKGYENLSLNMSDIRASLAQHQRILLIYEESYD
jgi:hypothetical protein